jgi:uncharacterized protein
MDAEFDKTHLIKLANTRIPFGKYQNKLLVELPEAYLVWFKQKGFPKGELGNMLNEMLEIKTNGLEYLLKPLIKR